jgi:8-oxo-dGTP diphosphatase
MGTIYYLVNMERKAVLDLDKVYRWWRGDLPSRKKGEPVTLEMVEALEVRDGWQTHRDLVLAWLSEFGPSELANENTWDFPPWTDYWIDWRNGRGTLLPGWDARSIYPPTDSRQEDGWRAQLLEPESREPRAEDHVGHAHGHGDRVGHEMADLSETEFLQRYRDRTYPRPSVSVDLVIFTILDSDLKVLLVQRKGHPFRGRMALPGGFVRVGDTFDDQGESVEDAARRELAEETGLGQGCCYLEQLYTFGEPGRDPRTRVISVAYFALISSDKAPLVQAGDDASDAGWYSVEHEVAALAFDHDDILAKALERIRGKIDYAPHIAFQLVRETFTASELRVVYEAVKGETYDAANFRRRFRRMQTDGLIELAPGRRQTGSRPAAVFRFAKRSEQAT